MALIYDRRRAIIELVIMYVNVHPRTKHDLVLNRDTCATITGISKQHAARTNDYAIAQTDFRAANSISPCPEFRSNAKLEKLCTTQATHG